MKLPFTNIEIITASQIKEFVSGQYNEFLSWASQVYYHAYTQIYQNHNYTLTGMAEFAKYFDHPQVFILFPFGVLLLLIIMARRHKYGSSNDIVGQGRGTGRGIGRVTGRDTGASTGFWSINRRRALLKWFVFFSRVLILALITLALAGPFTTKTKEIRRDPFVKLLIDNSSSMYVMNNVEVEKFSDELAKTLKVDKKYIGSRTDSRIYANILPYISPEENIILFSDGNNLIRKDSASLEDVAQYARSLNATISVITPQTALQDYAVRIEGPDIAMEGIESTFNVILSSSFGAKDKDARNKPKLVIKEDEDIIFSEVPSSSVITLNRKFTKGSHVLEASFFMDDFFSQNNKFYKTIMIVEKPPVALITNFQSPLNKVLSELYNLEVFSEVPVSQSPSPSQSPSQPTSQSPASQSSGQLSKYYAIVIDDQASRFVNPYAGELTDFVKDGNGLVVFGGKSSFDKSSYKGSRFETLLPVVTGSADKEDEKVNIAIVIDVSASTGGYGNTRAIDVEKAIAIDVLNQLGSKNSIGIAAFNTKGFIIQDVAKVTNKKPLADKIARLQDGGGTYISAGILTGVKMLNSKPGSKNIILISDGQDNPRDNWEDAAKIAWNEGVKIYTIGTGDVKESTLVRIAQLANGVYIPSENANKIKLVFGKEEEETPKVFYELAILDESHFITSGLDFKTSVTGFNQIVPKDISRLLVTTSNADPIVASWQFGIGRVVVFGSDNGNEWAGRVYGNSSRLITRIVNYAISDPQRKADEWLRMSDTTEGVPATIRVKSKTPPISEKLAFKQGRDFVYTAELDASELGVFEVMGSKFAVNYNEEYQRLGYNTEIENIAELTSGQVLQMDVAQVYEYALSRAKAFETVKTYAVLPFIMLGIFLFLLEILIRRLVQNALFASQK